MDRILQKAELLICLCRKELYFGKIEEMKKKCVEKKDSVARMEGNFFLKLKADYEECFAKGKEEFLRAEKELENTEKELLELDRKIAKLGNNIEGIIIEEITDEQKELYSWCCLVEKLWDTYSLLHRCIEMGEAESLRVISHAADLEKNAKLHEDIDAFFEKLDEALSMVGKVRYLAGLRVKNGFRTNRSEALGGKTLMFLREGYAPFKLDIHDCYLREMESSWATRLALESKLKELKQLELLCRGILQKLLPQGKLLLENEKAQGYLPSEKDIFRFDIGEK